MPRLRLFNVEPAQLWPLSLRLLRDQRDEAPCAPRLVLAPSAPTARMLVRAAGRARGGAVNLRALTLPDLARAMAAPRRDVWLLPPRADHTLVAEFLADHPGPLGERALRPAVIAAVAASLRDLRQAGLPELGGATSDPTLAHVAQLLRWFAHALAERRLADDATLYELAVGGPPPGDAGAVLVHGIYDVTGVQERLLADLARRCDMDWLLPLAPPDSPAAAIVEELRGKLEGLGFEPAAVDLLALTPAAPPVPTILACAGAAAEAREVARSVLAAARDGVAFGDMAVLVTNLDSQAPPLQRELERAGVPVAARAPDPITERPSGRALRALADLVQGVGARAAAVAVLKERLAAEPRGAVDVAAVERLVRRAALGRPDRRSWTARLESAARGLESEARRLQGAPAEEADDETGGESRQAQSRLLAEADRSRRLAQQADALLGAVEAFHDEASGAKSTEDALAALERLLDAALGAGPAAAAGRQAAQALAGLAKLRVRPRPELLLDLWRSTFEDLAAPDDVAEPGGGERSGARGPRAWGEGVLIININRARGFCAAAAFIVGLAEGDFPAAPRPDPYLTDDLRRRIAKATGAPLRPRSRRLLETDLVFALARAAGRERLVCSWPRQDDASGAIRLPAEPLARWIEERQGQLLDPVDPANARDVTPVPAQLPLPDDAARPLLNLSEYDLSLVSRAAGGGGFEDAHAFHRRLWADFNRWRVQRCTEHDGVVGALAPPEAFSVTGLERLAVCPLRFFLRDILGLAPVLDPDRLSGPRPLDVGTAIHLTLKELFAELVGREAPDDAEALRLAASAPARLAAHVDVLLRQGVVGGAALWQGAAARIGRDLAKFALDEMASLRASGRRIAEMELLRQGRMPTPSGAVDIVGQPDRVDRGPDGGLRVTDYKWSKSTHFPRVGDALLQGGARLQLPLYAWLLMTAPGETANVEEVRYAFPKAESPHSEVSVPRGTLEARRQDVEDVVGELARLACEGAFFPVPDEGVNCRFCDFRLLCGPGKEALEQRKRRDPRYENHATRKERFP